PTVLVGHRLRPRDPRPAREPRLLVLVAPALEPPQPEPDAQHREPFVDVEQGGAGGGDQCVDPRWHRLHLTRAAAGCQAIGTGGSLAHRDVRPRAPSRYRAAGLLAR